MNTRSVWGLKKFQCTSQPPSLNRVILTTCHVISFAHMIRVNWRKRDEKLAGTAYLITRRIETDFYQDF